MRKIIAIIAFFAGFSAAVAQDTITMFDSFYLYRPLVVNNTEIFCDDKDYYYYPYDDIHPVATWIQMYEVTSPTTIYGVAVSPDRSHSLSINWDSVHPYVDVVAVVYTKEGPNYYVKVDSVVCGMSYRSANILYQDLTTPQHYCYPREIMEFYFENPCVVSDTCFIGIYCDYHIEFNPSTIRPIVNVLNLTETPPYWGISNGLKLLSDRSGVHFPFVPSDAFTLKPANGLVTLDSNELFLLPGMCGWGGTFPIIGFHCKTAPEGFRTVGTGGGYCDLAWNSLSGDTYEVAVGHWGESPDSVSRRYLTTDTTIRIDSLEPGTLYQAWVRGQCRYATVSYDTSLWSPWSIRMPIMVTTGIQQAEGPHFTLTPNPASGTVTVGGFEGEGSVEIVDMAGRVSGQWPVAGGQRTIDISRLPAGSYVVRLTTAEGTASRMLQVE